jgi:homoserine dehydrogenase
MKEKINIGLLGFGTVGVGVAKLLLEKRDLIRSRVGAELVLCRVADIDIETDRGLTLDPSVLCTDAHDVVADPSIDIVVEMIGGEGIAFELIEKAIAMGKPVVTANKALLAHRGTTLFRSAAAKGVDLMFEAAVGGCMPIIKSLRESLVGNDIRSMTGILNGTCNYILSKITAEGSQFKDVLAEAQAEGYAEADPTLDVGGFDTAHKLAILTALAYGTEVNFDDIYIEGISGITPLDIELADQFGYRIKLLAISKRHEGAVEARVHPTMIPRENPLAVVNGTMNAVTITGDAVGDTMLYGHGAGRMPTASAVLSDLADVARNLIYGSVGRVPLWGHQPEAIAKIPVLSVDEVSTHYYFRFLALDQPGVLSRIAGVLGEHDISIKSVHQKGRKTNGAVPVVMFTHRASESDVQEALAKIMHLEVMAGDPLLIRIEDEEATD